MDREYETAQDDTGKIPSGLLSTVVQGVEREGFSSSYQPSW